ncbi:hypothetical protein BAE44_0017718 [Dichanthelium oligosanthes]|uniref:Uncharacterized protein n=1 Tax=Dichanthelium oligosanthes TaxID=888268 RepID=A0A1E5V7X6_9POAL|nr:hypothetical protein BAE44_0017718 [Dichanthelium oligosanthes]
MAAASGADKENAAPSTSAATAVAVPRRHGYAVKSCGVKKRPSRAARPLGRVPLRDITNLIAVSSAVAGPEAPLGEAVSSAAVELVKPVPAVAKVAAVQDGVAGRSAVKALRYSLRKQFR